MPIGCTLVEGGDKRWSGRRASNPLPRPWQGRALPSELLPLGQRKDHTLARPAASLGQAWLRLEDFLDGTLERSRQRKRQRKAWIVLARFNRVHGLARHPQAHGQVRLR